MGAYVADASAFADAGTERAGRTVLPRSVSLRVPTDTHTEGKVAMADTPNASPDAPRKPMLSNDRIYNAALDDAEDQDVPDADALAYRMGHRRGARFARSVYEAKLADLERLLNDYDPIPESKARTDMREGRPYEVEPWLRQFILFADDLRAALKGENP